MTQRVLDQAVACATGESLATIRRLGFGLAAEANPSPQPTAPPAAEAQEAPHVTAA
jgi:hypothetical protein